MKPHVLLHIGAHRTGTTSLQNFLRQNRDFLDKAGIGTIHPPETRQYAEWADEKISRRFIVSEENIWGTMEQNIRTGEIYPGGADRVSQLLVSLDCPATIFVTIRSTFEWWRSQINFGISRGTFIPEAAHIDGIISAGSRWHKAIEDLSRACDARIIVREFNWKTDNPKRQLIEVTGWKEIEQAKVSRDINNRSPNEIEIATQLAGASAHELLKKYETGSRSSPFTEDDISVMNEQYEESLSTVASLERVELKQESEQERRKRADLKTGTMPRPTAIAFLHIGKTGGTYFKSRLASSAEENPNLKLGNHSDTLLTTAEELGDSRRVGFFFRDPASRFVSAFHSRMRQGRPTYDVLWSPAEASAFSFFEDANSLAESIYSDDKRMESAARFAMASIQHLKNGYQHYLISPEAIEFEHRSKRVLFCCPTELIDAHWARICELFQSASPRRENVNSEGIRHSIGQHEELSPTAVSSLREFWRREYEIYEACLRISHDLHFD
ncbi:hypothetical protein [Pseudoroseicyclus sp. CXY001]|uniref:hypothetical protein n=1 Tax=Pseudoroseicyclus sp. CXY001 TaxID=3242492 RepID=UPI003570F507